jgi:hypothetical protein
MLARTRQMPLANLCKPTYCHRHPVDLSNPDPPACAFEISASALRAFDSALSYGGRHAAFHRDTSSPQAAPWYRAATRLVPRRQLGALTISPSGSPAFPDGARADLLGLCANRGRVRPDIPCRAPSIPRTASGSPASAKVPSPYGAPTPHASNTWDIFRRQILSACAPHRSEKRSFKAATGISA